MANRIQSGRSDGTFRRSTLADIGLDCDVCPNPDCRSFCPRKLGIEKRPTHCHACGSMLEWEAERLEEEWEFTQAVRDFRDMWSEHNRRQA